jgi:hypothetical protein
MYDLQKGSFEGGWSVFSAKQLGEWFMVQPGEVAAGDVKASPFSSFPADPVPSCGFVETGKVALHASRGDVGEIVNHIVLRTVNVPVRPEGPADKG